MPSALSVFAAPFTAEAADAVTGSDGIDATIGLAALLDHSMVTPAERPDGKPGFRLLEVIRAFAAERLADPGRTRRRLEGHKLDVLERAGAEQGSQGWARRLLDSEEANLAVALQWAVQQRVFDQILRRLGDVWVWSLVRGNLRRSTALRQQIEAWPAEILRSEHDRMARNWLRVNGFVEDGRWAELGVLVDQILTDARRIEDPSRWGLMLMARAGARPYGPDSPARAEFAEALTVTRDTRSAGPVSARGEPAHRADNDHRDGLTRRLGMLSALALERGDPRLAARLTGATAGARDDIGIVPWPAIAEAERRVTERIQARLHATEYSAEAASGRSTTVQTAISHALSSLATSTPPVTP